jgi:hypothetical protein
MGNFYVHVHMKKCCQGALGDIDRAKGALDKAKGTKAKGSLKDTLGKLPIEVAKGRLKGGGTGSGHHADPIERKAQATCAEICAKHAEEHQNKGETKEASFWVAAQHTIWHVAPQVEAGSSGSTAEGAAGGATPETHPATHGNAGTTPTPGNGASGSTPNLPYVGMSQFAQARGFVVTSTTGGKHNEGSAHYEGRAIDVRTNDKTDAEIRAFMDDARAAGMSVRDERAQPSGQKVWGGPHIHLSVPAGATFP